MRLKQFFYFIPIALLLTIFFPRQISAQMVRAIPAQPEITDTLLFIFDSNQGNQALKDYNGAVYFHAGLITDRSKDGSDWKFVVGEWGQPDERVKMIPMGAGLYRASLPLQSFFGVDEDILVKQLALVFRNADGSLVGKTADESDFFINFKGYQPEEKILVTKQGVKGKYLGQRVEGSTLFVSTDLGEYTFRAFADSILEVGFHPGGFQGFDSSHAVILKPGKVDVLLTETPNALMFDLPGMQVFIQKKNLDISYLSNGRTLLKEEKGFFSSSQEVGFRFEAQQGERFYGSGGRAHGMDLRGKKLGLYNRAHYGYELGATDLNYMIPLMVSNQDYLILFDNPQKAQLDVDSNRDGIVEFSAMGGPQRFYLVHSHSYAGLMKQYGQLTGKQELPPRWVFGNLQSRMAYRTQAETDSIVNLMIDQDFPLDAIILDFYWFGDSILGHLGRLDWYKPSWPEPEKMIADFASKGVKTITISEPFIIDSLANFEVAKDLDILAKDTLGNVYIDKQFYFGNGSLIDIFKPEAADWLWSKYKTQFEQGVAGLWGDLGEPESHPSDLKHVVGMADEVHNIYGHYWAKSIYERFRRDYPKRRLFFLARSGFAGSQRYSMFPWTGDVSRSWGGLQAQLPAMLNMSMSGVPYMHSDAGGFALGEKDDELYTRWLQYAVFTPILRPHGSGVPSEPVYFNDTTKRIVRDFMKLRYRLLPYIYTAAWKTATVGIPIAKPVFFYYPDDERFENHYNSYFFGSDLLVAPVTSPGINRMQVELPAGLWYHFWSGEQLYGGKAVGVNVALESIPVFARAGSIIPMTKSVNTTDHYNSRMLFLKTYLHDRAGKLKGEVFEDDGQTYGTYQSGDYELLTFEGKQDAEGGMELLFTRSGNGFAGMPEIRVVDMEIFGKASALKKVRINDMELQPLNADAVQNGDLGFWTDSKGRNHVRLMWAGEDIKLTAE
ncbi:MAG: oligosaccharide 4-alpha-D-glucosyltransferase [Bacteroidales bacterium]|nr:oligosaccharide 4-alpha-D-glucosyltransferase [Bacteroidales bacterium]